MWRRLLGRTRRLTDEQVIMAALIVARDLGREDADHASTVADLQAAGFDEAQANRFIELLPMAFSLPVLEHFGVKVTATVGATTEAGDELRFRLDRQPEYVAGLALARRHRETGCMPHWAYNKIAGSSAELDAISNALNEGMDVEGGVMASALVSPDMTRFLVK